MNAASLELFACGVFVSVVMETHIEQRAAIKFCFKCGKTATETFEMLKQIARVRPHFHATKDWFLLHDNAPAYNAGTVRKFLMKKNVVVLNHSPYSPDLAPADYFLFPKLKLKLKGRRFEDVATIQANVTRELYSIPQADFEHALKRLAYRSQRCIDVGGVYIE